MVRDNMKNFWDRYKYVISIVAGTLALMATWQSMDHILPRWTWWSETKAIQSELVQSQHETQEKLTEAIEGLQQQVASNTKLILGNEWFRLSAKLKEKRAQLSRSPGDRELIEEVTRLERQLREVERKLDGS